MEGPTPVSALIHAATMVNAGVYLIARTSLIFAHATEIMVVVAAIGTFTAILAASIAFTQTDIKRVLAYSTLSQLGYMFAALGVGAWTAAIFHLMAHGFFKGLLFLDSGSVIHAVHDEQDMRKMGGLSKKIPVTYWTMLIGSIAISGIPPLAGFFSKDEILGEAFKSGFLWVWAVGFLVAGMTAFYMFRLMGLTFWGTSRVDPAVEPDIHESAPGNDDPADPAVDPDRPDRPVPGPAVRGQPDRDLARAGLRPGGQRGRRGRPAVRPVRDRRRPDPGQCHGRRDRDRPRLALLRGGPRAAPGEGRPADVNAIAGANGATRFLYRASLNKWWFDDLNDLLFIRHRRADRLRPVVVRPERHRRRGQRDRPAWSARPVAGCAGSRPVASRTTPWASPSG